MANDADLLRSMLEDVPTAPRPIRRSMPTTVRPSSIAPPLRVPGAVRHTEARRKRTAIVSGDAVDHVINQAIRIIAGMLLVLSFFGSVMAFNNDKGWDGVIAAWPRPWEAITLFAFGAGVAIQLYLTIVQLHQRHNKWGMIYLIHLGVDVVLTYLGYYVLVSGTFVSGFAAAGFGEASAMAANVVIAILAIGMARVPETVLID